MLYIKYEILFFITYKKHMIIKCIYRISKDNKKHKMKQLIIILSTLLLTIVNLTKTYSQGEANVWYFGNGAGLDFNTNPPTQLENGNINLTALNREGVGGMSDVNGNLLFYTDGRNVYDKNHTQMLNGFGLLGGNGSSTQSGLSLKVNGSTTQYFIISTNNGGSNRSYYSIVDMTLNSGLGNVTVKNSPLVAANCSEGVVAVPVYDASNNPTGENWVIFHDFNSASYRVYRTNGATISFSGTYTVGFAIPSQPTILMKTNACFNRIAISIYNSARVEILPFNNVTGVISAPSLILSGSGGNPFLNLEVFGIEFSPNDRFIYVAESGLNNRKTVYQFDISLGVGLNPPLVLASKSFFTGDATVVRFGHLQLAPNGRIYVPGYKTTTPTFLSEIPTPNIAWTKPNPTATEFVFKKYQYNAKLVGEGLPVFSQDLLRAIKIYYNNACEAGTTNFSYIFGGSAISQSWNFGDPASGILNTSTLPTPSHVYSVAGTYLVTLTVVDQCGRSRTQTVNVIVKTVPTYTYSCALPCIIITGTGTNASNYTWDTNINGTFTTIGTDYNYCGTLPATIYVKDPTPLATYTTGNSTAAATAGADVGHTYFEIFTPVTLSQFQVIARLNGQSVTFTVRDEALTTTYWSGAAPLSVANTIYTFNPNVILPIGRYVILTSNVAYAFRNNTDEDGNRDVVGVINVLGEKNGLKGGSFINIRFNLPDPCGVRAIPLSTSICPSPIELIDFIGFNIGNKNQIYWSTKIETNFNYFILEKSNNGKDFYKVDTIYSKGNNSNYGYLDNTNSQSYYRLKIVDNDGTYVYSNTIVLNYDNYDDISIYPNPSKTNFTINSTDSFDVNVYTIDGKLIYSKDDSTNLIIGDEYETGTYLLKIKTKNKFVTKKIIKQQ